MDIFLLSVEGLITIVAKWFDVAHSTVYQLWEWAAHTHATGDIISLEINSWKKLWEACYISNRGHPGGVKDVLLSKRCTQRKLATLMGV